MFDQETTQYSPWMDQDDRMDICYACRKKRHENFGVLKRRRVKERDGNMYSQYKVVCPVCGKHTETHRSKQIAIREWSGKNDPENALMR